MLLALSLQCFDYGKSCYSSPAFLLAVNRSEKQEERRVLNKCMQLGFVSEFVRTDAVGLIDSLGSHSFRSNIIIPYCFPHFLMQIQRNRDLKGWSYRFTTAVWLMERVSLSNLAKVSDVTHPSPRSAPFLSLFLCFIPYSQRGISLWGNLLRWESHPTPTLQCVNVYTVHALFLD